MRRLITAELVAAEAAAGRLRIAAPRGEALITPEAWSRARELGVLLDLAAERAEPSRAPAAQQGPAADPGSAERVVDPSGVTLVRGQSVRMGRFTGAGPDRDIGLTDLITARDGAPMTAGIMAWQSDDSFPWTLDYDEVDLVLEGVLEIRVDGRVLRGGAGDVFYIPKGSKIVFGTPARVRVFYVTWPADWAAAAAAPRRPGG